MPKMIKSKIDELILDLSKRRTLADSPPVVLLGAGASVESGIEAMDGLLDLVGCSNFGEFVQYIEPRTPSERYRILAEYLQTRNPTRITPGYKALAQLCAEAYFDIILTTNLDPLLEDALAGVNLRRRDYVVFVNGVIRPERLKFLLQAPRPRVKIIKLHGDLFLRFMAWTPKEMEDYLSDIEPSLMSVINGRDLLVQGHSLRDNKIRKIVQNAGGAIWYLNPEPVPDKLQSNPLVRAIIGDKCRFERIFPLLSGALGTSAPIPPSEVTKPEPSSITVDDLMASLVGVRTIGNAPNMTGFLLQEPRVIVTDGYYHNIQGIDFNDVHIVTRDGVELGSKVVRHVTEHPFGPLILKAPDEMHAAGLRLDYSPVEKDTNVQIAVAAGTRTGLSAGRVSTGLESAIHIDPIGNVKHLVEIKASVAPGSSGSPVVDQRMAVRGFIVAGSMDFTKPQSFIYPTCRWHKVLE